MKKGARARRVSRLTELTEEEWKEGLKFVDLVDRQVGTTSRDRLAWVVRAVQRNPKDMTPGDRENFRVELAGFYHFETHAKGKPYNPTDEEAQEALRAFCDAIQCAVRREDIVATKIVAGVTGQRVRSGDFLSDVVAVWDPGANRFVLWDCSTAEWPTRAVFALVRLLVEYGHLVKECPAPLPRDEEVCGVWFVAKRPKQEYCSATCQSRASTRAARAGTATPAAQRREAEKEG